MVRQCLLAGISRATVYAQQKPKLMEESDLLLIRLIDEEYTRHPFYVTRRMVVFLKVAGHTVNRCEFSPLRSHSVIGVKAPQDCRRNGATRFAA